MSDFPTYAELANKHLSVGIKSGNEWMVKCVFHDDSNASMQFNVAKGLFICFSCHARGNTKTLMRKLGISYQQEGLDVAEITARLDALRNPTAEVLTTLDESFLLQYDFETGYWASRGFSMTTRAAFDLGYHPLHDYVTIPIRNIDGGLLGVIKRYIGKDVEQNQRYRYPKGFKRSCNMFGSWLVQHDEECDTVVLVEGAIDAMKVWQAGYQSLAVYGSSISTQQIRILKRLGIVRIVLMFDDDKAGRECEDTALGWHSSKRGGDVQWKYDPITDLRRDFVVDKCDWRRTNLVDDLGNRITDPGAMTSEQVRAMLQAPRRVT